MLYVVVRYQVQKESEKQAVEGDPGHLNAQPFKRSELETHDRRKMIGK